MSEEKQSFPEYFVYQEQGNINIEKSLYALPENPDKSSSFFREVPEWFEIGSKEELLEIISNIDNMPEQERKRISEEDFKTMHLAFERLLLCQNISSQKDLTPVQKEFIRCLCYWESLVAMDSIPLSPEEEADIWQ